jgi:hypothetical protein
VEATRVVHNAALVEEIEHEVAALGRGLEDIGSLHYDTEAGTVADVVGTVVEGSSYCSHDMGGRSRCTWTPTAGIAGDSGYTVAVFPYPVAYSAALPADDRSSYQLGDGIQLDRVLGRIGDARCKRKRSQRRLCGCR